MNDYSDPAEAYPDEYYHPPFAIGGGPPPWQLPDYTWGTEPVTPEIPVPDEIEAIAQFWDALIFGFGDALRYAWNIAAAALMAERRALIAVTGAHTENDYYGSDHG